MAPLLQTYITVLIVVHKIHYDIEFTRFSYVNLLAGLFGCKWEDTFGTEKNKKQESYSEFKTQMLL